MHLKEVLWLKLILIIAARGCNVRKTEIGFICVCNATFCDKVPDVKTLQPGEYQFYFTGKLMPGFNVDGGFFSKKGKHSKNAIKINVKKQFQKIVGFGGAFTDATGINIRSLPKTAQKNLIESYFGKDGIGYSLCRVPIGGTDFSLRPYTYDDYSNDTKLEHFKLQEEDFEYKIPFITEARKLRGAKNLKLIASAWTAPVWMKTKPIYTGYSLLKDEYYQLWSDYTVKFFDEYEKLNIKFWGVTTGNEPLDGFFTYSESKINAMGWVPIKQIKWIHDNLGPDIRKSAHKDLKIIIHDEARVTVPYVVPLMLNDERSLKYIDGVGLHWYWDDRVPVDVLSLLETDKKDLLLLSTESCFFREGLKLGSWDRAAGYVRSILEYLENGFGGWIDWNMALDLSGGPTYIGYEADSPLLVNATSQEFYKQPMFYAMGHFSKFILPDSVRLETSYFLKENTIQTMAFLRPDNLVVLVIFNDGDNRTALKFQTDDRYSSSIEVDAKSIYTVLFPVKDHER